MISLKKLTRIHVVMAFGITVFFSALLCSCATGSRVGSEKNSAKNISGKSSTTIEGLEFFASSCYGTCPSYSFEMQSNGHFKYEGISDVKLSGKFEGLIQDPWEFKYVAEAILGLGFDDLEDSYGTKNIDSPNTTIRIWRDGGKSKVVSLYGDDGFRKLWAIQVLIEKLKDDTLEKHKKLSKKRSSGAESSGW